MAGSSAYLDNKVLLHVFGGVEYTMPTSLELALYIGDPDQGGVEVDGTSYARQPITFDGTDGTAESNSSIEFPQAPVEWGVVTHLAVLDESGNILAAPELSASLDIGVGDIARFSAGGVIVNLD